MRISIALCTFNGGQFLEKQLESLLKQSRVPDEIVICDDGSQDRTMVVLQEFRRIFPGEICIHINPTQLGPRLNFEKAISLCTGDIIFLCDQDDIWNAGKVERTVRWLEQNPEMNGVFCNGNLMNTTGENLGETMWDSLYFEEDIRKQTSPENLLQYLFLNGNIATGTAMAFRRSVIPQVLPFFTEYETWHDQWIALVLAAQKKLYFLDEVLLSYRIHPGQQVGFQGRGRSMPEFRQAVHQTWLMPYAIDLNGIVSTHSAWGFQKFERYHYALKKSILQMEHVNETGRQIKKILDFAKKSWYKQMPWFLRKTKLLKHWLKGGEYLRISLKDIFFI